MSGQEFLLFDFDGHVVGVHDLQIAERGLQFSWVTLGKVKVYTEQQIEDLLTKALHSLLAESDIEPEESAPTPIQTPPESTGWFAKLIKKVKELF